MLVEQYRMNQLIMEWSSEQMYQGKLVAHPSVSQRTIRDLVARPADTSAQEESKEESKVAIETGDIVSPLLFIDTAGALMYEGVDTDSGANESKYNYGEVDLVIQTIKELLEIGLAEADIGVITPYSAQASEIRKELKMHQIGQTVRTKVEVSTVDGFQGREKEVIIISMVRSNAHHTIGFLSNEKRMNVAVTRAKRLCALIGDSGTVSKNAFLASLCAYFREHGQVRTAFDY